MSRILTGIQSSGKPHLGNLLGAVIPAIELANEPKNNSYIFIADLHSLTTIKDSDIRIENVYSVAAAWLAFGLDVNKSVFYRQSHVPEVCELTWYLNCFMPYSKLKLAHSFKDKSSNLEDVNSGLFTYPTLMCADILMYDAEIIPVGKDQKQHVEYAKEIARKINHYYGEDLFVIPKIKIDDSISTIPGVDGRKMSKSYSNYIDIFVGDKALKKNIMSIVTDSKEKDEIKSPNECNVFNIYAAIADKGEVESMKEKYVSGSYGYGDAKIELYNTILSKYEKERELYNEYIGKTKVLNEILELGEVRARETAKPVLHRVRKKMGFIE